MKISVIGCGYVGSVTGACLADLEHTVTLVDVDGKKVNSINACRPQLYEPGLDALLTKNREKILATSDVRKGISGSDITFVCVGTPPNPDGSIGLDAIGSAAHTLGKVLKKKRDFHTIVVKSTVLPGTTEDFFIPIIEKTSGKKALTGFGIAVNPEFLQEGTAIDNFFHPDRIIIGSPAKSTGELIDTLYSSFSCPHVLTSIKTAEMIKYASNAFLATKISFANEIGNLCKQIGIDTYDVFYGVGLDKRIGPAFFRSGIGFGGSCFPKDVMALIRQSEDLGLRSGILESVIRINDEQPKRIVSLLQKHIPEIKNRSIGILGLSFKPGTDDIRDSRAIPVIEELIRHGARIIAYDPAAMENFRKIFPDITYASNPSEVLEADAVLIVTEWDVFGSLDYRNMIVIDGRRMDKPKREARIYEGVCW